MKFKKVTIDDLDILKNALTRYGGRICDISPANLVFWRDYYDISYSLDEDGLVIRYGNMDDETCFFCEPSEALAKRLIEYCGGSVRLTCVCDADLEYFGTHFDVSDVWISEDWNDYLYNAEDIVTLKGKKYSGQRNHINKFNSLYTGAVFKEIEKEDVPAVKRFCQGYFHDFGNERADVAEYEEEHLYEQLDSLDLYKQNTGVLMYNGNVLGFSIGEVVGDTLIIHTEKANTAYKGVYPTIVQEFAKMYVKNGVRFINREEDCGVPGLRTSKRSYHPVEILNKYSVVIS